MSRLTHTFFVIFLFPILSGCGREDKIDDGASGVAFHKGYVASKNSEWSSAIIHFTKAIELDPTNINAYNHRGFGFSKQEQYIEAIADFTKAVELAPKYADAYENRGAAYKALGKNQEADADFAKGKRIKMTVPANSKTDADETGK